MRNLQNLTALVADQFIVCPVSGACFVSQTVEVTVPVFAQTKPAAKKAAAPKRVKRAVATKKVAKTIRRVKRTLKTISATIGRRCGITPQLVGLVVKSWWIDTRREVRAIVAQLLKGLMSQGHWEVSVIWDKMRWLNLL